MRRARDKRCGRSWGPSLTPGLCAPAVGCRPRYLKTIQEPRLRGQEYGQTAAKARNLLQLLMNQKSLSHSARVAPRLAEEPLPFIRPSDRSTVMLLPVAPSFPARRRPHMTLQILAMTKLAQSLADALLAVDDYSVEDFRRIRQPPRPTLGESLLASGRTAETIDCPPARSHREAAHARRRPQCH